MEPPRTVNRHRVVLVNDRGQACAVPGKLVVREGDEIVFQSVGAGEVSLVFPRGILVADSGGAEPGVDYRFREDETPVFIARLSGVEPGIYTYAAYCRALNDVALGGSQPRIIIYR